MSSYSINERYSFWPPGDFHIITPPQAMGLVIAPFSSTPSTGCKRSLDDFDSNMETRIKKHRYDSEFPRIGNIITVEEDFFDGIGSNVSQMKEVERCTICNASSCICCPNTHNNIVRHTKQQKLSYYFQVSSSVRSSSSCASSMQVDDPSVQGLICNQIKNQFESTMMAADSLERIVNCSFACSCCNESIPNSSAAHVRPSRPCNFCEKSFCCSTRCTSHCDLCNGIFCRTCSITSYSMQYDRTLCLDCSQGR